jgi:uncharacterized protein (UPF0332 family)
VTDEAVRLIELARRSLAAAHLLLKHAYPEIAASRAYYSMFYLATAVLLRANLRFKKHASVHSAFG